MRIWTSPITLFEYGRDPFLKCQKIRENAKWSSRKIANQVQGTLHVNSWTKAPKKVPGTMMKT